MLRIKLVKDSLFVYLGALEREGRPMDIIGLKMASSTINSSAPMRSSRRLRASLGPLQVMSSRDVLVCVEAPQGPRQ